jgi:hypothetical protein
MALEGTGDLVFRGVAVYVFALMVVGLDWVAALASDETPRLHYIPLTQSAPVLTAGATIALGLHVAVYNLTHGANLEPYTGRILARLRLFADTGLAVAILAAGSGVLMLVPKRDGADPDPPLDVLGFALSAVVAVTACLAAHIIPADVTSRVASTQRSRDEQWLGQAVKYWGGTRDLSWVSWSWRVVWLVALLVLPLGVGEYLDEGRALNALWDGTVAGAALALLPVTFLIGFAALLHRDYVFAVVLAVLAVGSAIFIVVVLLREVSGFWSSLLVLGCAVWPWVVLLLSASRPSSRRVRIVPRVVLRVVPRVVRRWLWCSLNWRYRRLASREESPSRLLVGLEKVFRRSVRWFKQATGRLGDDARSESVSDQGGIVAGVTSRGVVAEESEHLGGRSSASSA